MNRTYAERGLSLLLLWKQLTYVYNGMFINTTPDTPKGEKSGDIFLSFSLELSAANMLWPFQNMKITMEQVL